MRTHEDFVKAYYDIASRAFICAEKARKEGLLALEEIIDREKVKDRDIFEYGLQFVLDGIDYNIINRLLNNLIEQETSENRKILKKIQKEAVLGIQEGLNPRIMGALLNSYTDLSQRTDLYATL
jgi:flagellar motor component MotA